MCKKRKIIQLLNSTWQGRLLGLGDDGVTYELNDRGFWVEFIPGLEDTTKAKKLC